MTTEQIKKKYAHYSLCRNKLEQAINNLHTRIHVLEHVKRNAHIYSESQISTEQKIVDVLTDELNKVRKEKPNVYYNRRKRR